MHNMSLSSKCKHSDVQWLLSFLYLSHMMEVCCLVGIFKCQDISKFLDSSNDMQHGEINWKRQNLGQKMYFQAIHFYFFMGFFPVVPKGSKINQKWEGQFFLWVIIIWYALHTMNLNDSNIIFGVFDILVCCQHVININALIVQYKFFCNIYIIYHRFCYFIGKYSSGKGCYNYLSYGTTICTSFYIMTDAYNCDVLIKNIGHYTDWIFVL